MDPASLYIGAKFDSNGNGSFDAKEQELLGQILVTWVPTAVDTDGDGVHDDCDCCPTLAAPVPSADGCPSVHGCP